MKIIVNEKEFNIARISRNIGNNDSFSESLCMAFAKKNDVDEIMEAIPLKQVVNITLKRDDYPDKIYKGYTPQNIVEEDSADGTAITLMLIK